MGRRGRDVETGRRGEETWCGTESGSGNGLGTGGSTFMYGG